MGKARKQGQRDRRQPACPQRVPPDGPTDNHAGEELERLNRMLERRVAERTREIRLLHEALSNLAEGVMITAAEPRWPHSPILFVNRAMCRISRRAPEELLNRTPETLHGGQTDQQTVAELGRELARKRPCHAEVVHYRKDGQPYVSEIFITPLLNAEGHCTHLVSIHRDVTRRKQTEGELADLGRIIDESLNEIHIFDAATLRFVQLNRGARANLGRSMDELRSMTPLDLKPGLDRRRFASMLDALRSGRERKVVYTARQRRKDGSFYDVEADLQLTQYQGRPCFVEISLDATRRRELEHEVIHAAETERQRIARDLHDDLGALLTGIKYAIEAAGNTIAGSGRKAAAGRRKLLRLATEAITKTRSIARGLHPVGNDPQDLTTALRCLRDQVHATSGPECRLRCPVPVLVACPAMANQLFRIAQEAVNNAVKHSGCSRLTIGLRAAGGAIELTVADNGSGFVPDAGKGKGLGLHIMNYRAESIGATLRISPRRGGGTRVSCRAPA